jgi:hypothetical protein
MSRTNGWAGVAVTGGSACPGGFMLNRGDELAAYVTARNRPTPIHTNPIENQASKQAHASSVDFLPKPQQKEPKCETQTPTPTAS